MKAAWAACLAATLASASAFAGSSGAASATDAASGAGVYHVVELDFGASPSVTSEALLGAFNSLDATVDREKLTPVLEKLGSAAKAVVVAGPKDECEKAAAAFEKVGMSTTVRTLVVEDLPSEYDDSDVVVAGGKTLTELVSRGEGLLVAFHAPWCAHCKTMAPELKQARVSTSHDVCTFSTPRAVADLCDG